MVPATGPLYPGILLIWTEITDSRIIKEHDLICYRSFDAVVVIIFFSFCQVLHVREIICLLTQNKPPFFPIRQARSIVKKKVLWLASPNVTSIVSSRLVSTLNIILPNPNRFTFKNPHVTTPVATSSHACTQTCTTIIHTYMLDQCSNIWRAPLWRSRRCLSYIGFGLPTDYTSRSWRFWLLSHKLSASLRDASGEIPAHRGVARISLF